VATSERIASHGVHPFRRAVRACEIFWRKQKDDALGADQRIVHTLDKIPVDKIPVLKDDAIVRAYEDAPDRCG